MKSLGFLGALPPDPRSGEALRARFSLLAVPLADFFFFFLPEVQC